MKKLVVVLLMLVNLIFLVAFLMFQQPAIVFNWLGFNTLGIFIIAIVNLLRRKRKRKTNYINNLVKWHKKQKKKPKIVTKYICCKCHNERPEGSTSRKCLICGASYVPVSKIVKKRGRKNAKS